MIVYNDKTLSIYCVLQGESNTHIELNNLFSVYNVDDNHKNSLDKLFFYFADLTAHYFIYKNNIKTDYVGFCQYNNIPQFDLDNFFKENGVCLGYNNGEESLYNFFKMPFVEFLQKEFTRFITYKYKRNTRIYKTFIKNAKTPVPLYIGRMYFCKWEYFIEIMECVTSFIDYINSTNELNWDPNEWHYFILDNFIDKKLTIGIPEEEQYWIGDNCRNLWKVMTFVCEIIIGVYFGNLVNEMNLPRYEYETKE